jgi:hypothetical protein
MAFAHASVGVAAAWPTTGTILIAAEPTRQGAAAKPQPLKAKAMPSTSKPLIINSPEIQ